MHVGYSLGVQNIDNACTDYDVFEREIRLADIAVDLGFESIWAVEHHFTDYLICPDPVQLLTWFAARYPHVRLGTGVVVLPWHEPVRCAEAISLLDNLSDGRLILGLGRGIARTEYDGFRVAMSDSRERFVEYAEVILDALETGVIESDGKFAPIPAREIRPQPRYSLKGRTYVGALSPEGMPIMAKLKLGLLIIPQKPWPSVQQDLDSYRQAWAAAHGPHDAPPAPICGGHTFVAADAAYAEEMARRYISGYYASVIKHYAFDADAHRGVKGYEFYAGISRHIERRGARDASSDYVDLMPWGTPDRVLEKLSAMRDVVGMSAINPWFSYAGMPPAAAEASLRLFAREVLPVLQQWEAEPLAPRVPLNLELRSNGGAPWGSQS